MTSSPGKADSGRRRSGFRINLSLTYSRSRCAGLDLVFATKQGPLEEDFQEVAQTPRKLRVVMAGRRGGTEKGP